MQDDDILHDRQTDTSHISIKNDRVQDFLLACDKGPCKWAAAANLGEGREGRWPGAAAHANGLPGDDPCAQHI